MQSGTLPNWLFLLYQALFLLLPWSVELNFGQWNLTIPSEPLIAVTGIGLGLEFFRQRYFPKMQALAWIASAWIVWQFMATLFSSMPVVSWKYWLVEAAHWWVFFFGLLCWPQMWQRLIKLFAWSMLGVVVYTIIHHAFYHFRADQALLAPMPFFPDHTLYSAVLVLLLFNPTPNLFPKGQGSHISGSETPFSFEAGVYLLALLLTASRAAWLSLIMAGVVGLIIYFQKQWRWWLLGGIITIGTGIFFQEKIQIYLVKDDSSMERYNRYSSATRMAADSPWTGFGPGTFQFQYIPYQKREDLTRISLIEPIRQRGPDNYGRGGGAHSEYFQALAELGWPGLVLWILLVFFTVRIAFQKFQKSKDRFWLLLGLALLSFFLHALVNNFLHDARVAALVWGSIGLLGSKIRK